MYGREKLEEIRGNKTARRGLDALLNFSRSSNACKERRVEDKFEYHGVSE